MSYKVHNCRQGNNYDFVTRIQTLFGHHSARLAHSAFLIAHYSHLQMSLKIIVMGVGGVGKSAITNRVVYGRWVEKV